MYKNATIKVAPGATKCYLGEGPHWNPVKEEMLYVDIFGKAVLRYIPKTQECYKVVVGEFIRRNCAGSDSTR